ncbi:hypothetical protein B0H16DRAFT_1742948 [Mycena metata]|uniref:Uncharacterized protein n=1 Tax=Mycena metata TaxID=1033252 RepID=A0AAD7H6Y6_9AGAR|nr:hypothetical protein B0H16DRAFT_1742948 [Mycena metata]
MAARCNLVRPPPDWRSSQGSSRFLCSFQADSDSDASKIFWAYDGIPHAHPSSRGSSHGVVVGSGLFDSDTQHARARARGQQCRSPPLLTSDPWTIGDRDSLAEAFHLDPGSNLSSALGQRVERLATRRISSRDESVFLHQNAVSLITAHQSSSPIRACSHSSVAPSPTPCRLDVRPSHGTAPTPPHSPPPSPHRHPASTAFTRSHPGASVGLPRPPVPDPSTMMCAAIRLHYPFRKHALHSLATSTSLTSPVLDPFLARCAIATAHPPRLI